GFGDALRRLTDLRFIANPSPDIFIFFIGHSILPNPILKHLRTWCQFLVAQLFDQYATAFLSRQSHLRYGALQPEELGVSVCLYEASVHSFSAV
ncbi:MAG: hypothetical protein CFE32_08960, partial [Alphaproteobacteria bacterium PA3]